MAAERPTYVVTLRPERGVDGVRALRWLLKTALRRVGLRAITAIERPASETDPTEIKQRSADT
jgi:hypothetical protein